MVSKTKGVKNETMLSAWVPNEFIKNVDEFIAKENEKSDRMGNKMTRKELMIKAIKKMIEE